MSSFTDNIPNTQVEPSRGTNITAAFSNDLNGFHIIITGLFTTHTFYIIKTVGIVRTKEGKFNFVMGKVMGLCIL